ncbi:hypothetical protein G7046_g6589 [Stylonectria norvegica]|nr:hypothetical protein G7046_g6589 [Stylonectria norvegica]
MAYNRVPDEENSPGADLSPNDANARVSTNQDAIPLEEQTTTTDQQEPPSYTESYETPRSSPPEVPLTIDEIFEGFEFIEDLSRAHRFTCFAVIVCFYFTGLVFLYKKGQTDSNNTLWDFVVIMLTLMYLCIAMATIVANTKKYTKNGGWVLSIMTVLMAFSTIPGLIFFWGKFLQLLAFALGAWIFGFPLGCIVARKVDQAADGISESAEVVWETESESV